MPHIADHAKHGFIPGQHFDISKRYDINLRYVPYVCRIERRDGDTRYVLARGTKGDLLGYMLWREEGVSELGTALRPCPGWRHAWPAVVVRTPAERQSLEGPPDTSTALRNPPPADNGVQIGTVGRDPPDPKVPDPSAHGLRPVRLETFDPDLRFREKEPAFAKASSELPKDHPAILLSGCEEFDQVDLILPAWHSLTAVNRAGKARLASKVSDLRPDSSYDPDRQAPVHSAWRVIKNAALIVPFGPRNGLAWQLGYAGRDGQAGLGMVVDNGAERPGPIGPNDLEETEPESTTSPRNSGTPPAPGQPAPTQGLVVGAAGVRGGGPLDTGGASDIHRLGADGDGNPFNSVHLQTNSLWLGPTGDATLEFDKPFYQRPRKLPLRAATFLRFDPFSTHEWLGRRLPGLYRWISESGFAFRRITINPPPAPPPGAPGEPTSVPREGPIEVDPGDGPEIPGRPQPKPRRPIAQDDDDDQRRESDGKIPIRPTRQNDRHRQIFATPLETGFPGILVIPQNYSLGEADLRNDGDPRPQDLERAEQRNPVVLNLFGIYRRVFGNVEPKYTQRPCEGRYHCGTAGGALVVSPPEVGGEDLGEAMAPDGIGKSDSGLVIAPGAYLAYGTPSDTAEKALISLGHVERPNASGERQTLATDGITENEIRADTQTGTRFGHNTSHDLGRLRTGTGATVNGAKVQLRRGTLANKPALAAGELYFTTDTGELFAGY